MATAEHGPLQPVIGIGTELQYKLSAMQHTRLALRLMPS